MSDQPADAFTILRSLGFNPTAQGLDRAVEGLARRLANYERALAETREMLAEAEKRGAVKALRAEAQRFRYAATGRPASPRSLHAQEIEERADRIESGQVTS